MTMFELLELLDQMSPLFFLSTRVPHKGHPAKHSFSAGSLLGDMLFGQYRRRLSGTDALSVCLRRSLSVYRLF
jgi:hypothetical protein